ncbi:Cyclin-dependent kinase-like 4 [Apiospora marii]|uniref:Cyclin-dependent kinase-like 4 n=1 Tax=Apiospora marii TaxID=335849 RepID=A0ABR1S5R1_9PEZI
MMIRSPSHSTLSKPQNRSSPLESNSSTRSDTRGNQAVGNETLPVPGRISAFRHVWNTGSRLLARCFKDHQYCSPLGKKLRNALVPDPLDKHAFLPVTAISELLTEKSIRDELAIHPCADVSQNASRWAALIVSPSEASVTGARKIFGLLSLINRVDLIEAFICHEPRHCDDELPFKRQDLPLDDQPCKYESLRGVSHFVLDNVLHMQWWFLAPVFRKARAGIPVQNLSEDVTLPMSRSNEQPQPDTGHSGTVKKVMIHASHYTRDQEPNRVTDVDFTAATSDANGMMPCAIKQLHLADGAKYEGHYADACKKETENLLWLGEPPHPNLIELLFVYCHKGWCYLVFPWASGNLRDFWKKWPVPDWLGPQDHLVRWIFSQALGLVQALDLIYETEAGSAPSGQGAVAHATSGDLKPENILWFMGTSKLKDFPNLGLLKISDFAGTQFHRNVSKSRVIWTGVHTTNTYQAPEMMTAYMVGQSSDLWSLGCVLLEFMTWYILGWQGVDEFSIARSVDNDPLHAATDDNRTFIDRYEKRRRATWDKFSRNFSWPLDTFFYSLPRGASLKRSVHNVSPFPESVQCTLWVEIIFNLELQHLNLLYQDSRCSRFCAAFLKVIEECFLRIDKRNRVSTKEILSRFDTIRREGEEDAEYWTQPPKSPVRAKTNLSEQIPEESQLDNKSTASSPMEDYIVDRNHVTETRVGDTGQSANRLLPMTVMKEVADSSPPKQVPTTMPEGDKRASFSSSEPAVSSKYSADKYLHSSHNRKLETGTEEGEPEPILREKPEWGGDHKRTSMDGESSDPSSTAGKRDAVSTHISNVVEFNVDRMEANSTSTERNPSNDSSTQDVSPRDLYSDSCGKGPKALPELLDSMFGVFRSVFPEPRLTPGMSRIRWTCSCGQPLFDDFAELEPGSLVELQGSLEQRYHGPQTDQTIHNFGQNCIGGVLRIIRTIYDLIQRGAKGVARMWRHVEIELPSFTANTKQPPTPSTKPSQHLLMCIDNIDTWTGLHQECIGDVTDDCQLFKFLRRQYIKSQSSFSWLTSRTVRRISLTRFSTDANKIASVHSHHEYCRGGSCVCIPPIERIHGGEYECSPVPMDQPKYLPVIGPNELTHYFRRPHKAQPGDQRILRQLPKRMWGPLTAARNNSELGWGLHIEEGWHLITIIFLMVVPLVLGSLGFGIAWSVTKSDIQGGFAVAGIVLAMVPIAIGLVALRDQSR